MTIYLERHITNHTPNKPKWQFWQRVTETQIIPTRVGQKFEQFGQEIKVISDKQIQAKLPTKTVIYEGDKINELGLLTKIRENYFNIKYSPMTHAQMQLTNSAKQGRRY